MLAFVAISDEACGASSGSIPPSKRKENRNSHDSSFITTFNIQKTDLHLQEKLARLPDARLPRAATAMQLARPRVNARLLQSPNYGDPPQVIICKVRWGPDFIYTLSDTVDSPAQASSRPPPSTIVDASNLGFNVETDAAGAALASCAIREHGACAGGFRRQRELLPELRRAAANGGGLLLLAFDGAQQWGLLSGRSFAEGAGFRVRPPPSHLSGFLLSNDKEITANLSEDKGGSPSTISPPPKAPPARGGCAPGRPLPLPARVRPR